MLLPNLAIRCVQQCGSLIWWWNCLHSCLLKIFAFCSSPFLKLLRATNRSLDSKTSLIHTTCLNMADLHTYPDICMPHARLARQRMAIWWLNNSWKNMLDTSWTWPEWRLETALQHPGHLCCMQRWLLIIQALDARHMPRERVLEDSTTRLSHQSRRVRVALAPL